MEMEGEDGVTSLCLGPTGRAKAEGEMLEERGGSWSHGGRKGGRGRGCVGQSGGLSSHHGLGLNFSP